ncbi:MAG: diaminopimelate epimerase [Candidatus Humimicrobiaceae bacterium]
MEIIFSKLHGQGNDFILINNIKNSLSLSKEEITYLCDRHFGIGADGLILVRDSKIGDFKMDYFNQDGSRAEMCGNGIRCMAKFIYEKNISGKANLSIETLAGIKNICMDISNGCVGNIKVNMGKPMFSPEKIPVKIEGMEEVFNYNLKINSKTFMVNLVSMGNPHCVIFLEEEEDLENFDIKKWGAAMEKHPIY